MKTLITWSDIVSRLEKHDISGRKIYGIPKGGMIVTSLLKKASMVYSPEDADEFLDDIIDSGATRQRYAERFPDKPFHALYDKTDTDADADAGWLVFPWEGEEMASIEDAVIRQIQFLGDDPNREGLRETPKRVVKAWKELFSGYDQKPETVIKVFEDGSCDEMVILKDIEFYSTCEHHMLPFFGKAHIAYIPDGRVIGVSKLARLLEIFSRRLQIQERIGQQVTTALMDFLKPLGAGCILEAQHFCIKSRGIQKQDSVMVTSSLVGIFRQPEVRAEFMRLVR